MIRSERDIYAELLGLARKRFVMLMHYSLGDFHKPGYSTAEIDEGELSILQENSETVKNLLKRDDIKERTAAFIFELLRLYTYGKNQFINFSAEYEKRLKKVYIDFLDGLHKILEDNKLGSDFYYSLIAAHRNNLKKVFEDYLNEHTENPIDRENVLKSVVSSNYSPELQTDLLGLELENIREPVIDIGCGSDARLTKYLRSLGVDITGIDRTPPENIPYIVKTDWMDFNFGVNTWGTVIAHQSFSINFIFRHNTSQEKAEQYAIKMMEILKSLKPGGSFYYAPGLPFMEDIIFLLPEYDLTRKHIFQFKGDKFPARYSTRITRKEPE